MEQNNLCSVIEAVLFVAGEPVEVEALQQALEVSEIELTGALNALESEYDLDKRGIRLLRFGGCVQLGTNPAYAPYVERLLQPIQRQSLSQAAMETLAVVAYKQPVTRSEIEAIRGVKCDYSVQSLTQKRLIVEVGRKDALGRPILYGTTDEFLRHFCISSLEELPQIDLTVPPEGDDADVDLIMSTQHDQAKVPIEDAPTETLEAEETIEA